MADYKKIDLQIGTEEQFEEKKLSLPVGTLVGITDPIHESELDIDLQTTVNSVSGKLDKPSGDIAEDSIVVVKSNGTSVWKAAAPILQDYVDDALLGG